MKKFLFFLFLLTFIVCQPSNEKKEEFKKRRKEHGRQMAECILKHENISPEFKKLIEENKDHEKFNQELINLKNEKIRRDQEIKIEEQKMDIESNKRIQKLHQEYQKKTAELNEEFLRKKKEL